VTTSKFFCLTQFFFPFAHDQRMAEIPVLSPARAQLAKKAGRYRTLASIVSGLDRYLSFPFPPRPCLNISIPSTISQTTGSIQLYFYTAQGKDLSPDPQSAKRPVLVNFHGGGFTIGHAVDDARWFRKVLQSYPDAVVVSVGYRLAPEHPYPTAIQDSADAVLWLWKNADQHNLDRTRFVLSGDSAGGNLALTVPLMLYNERVKQQQQQQQQSPASEQEKADEEILESRLAGLITFYPPTNWTRTREQRDATNPIAARKSMIKPGVFKVFDDSYLDPENLPYASVGTEGGSKQVDMAHPYLSPGLMPTSLLLAAYPPNVSIYTCGWDQLLAEGNEFRERLRLLAVEGQMAHVGGTVIEDVVHGFDKKPSFVMGNKTRDRMYGDAVRQLGVMWD
jgi:acetyl esterase/lipase